MRHFLMCLLLVLCLGHFASAQTTIEQIFSDVKVDIKSRKLDSAQSKLQVALTLSKNNFDRVSVEMIIANIDQLQGNSQKAIKSLLDISSSKETPNELKSLIALALAGVYKSQASTLSSLELESLKKAADVATSNIDFSIAQQQLSQFYSDAKSYDMAKEALEKILVVKDLTPWEIVSTRISMAELQLEQRKYEEARVEYNNALNVKSEGLGVDDLDFLNELLKNVRLGIADSYFQEGNYEKAKQQYTEILADKGLTEEKRQEANEKLLDIDKAVQAIKAKPKMMP